jgi:hypothetical protein
LSEAIDSAVVVATHSGDVQLGTLHASTPAALVSGASLMATTLAEVIERQKLYSMIQGRKHVRVEGWTTLAVMLGCTAREVENVAHEDGSYIATVELVRMSDGVVVARASAECGMDERTWADRARYARRSMAATRATGKACRLAFSWIMALAGFEATPAEEMPEHESPRDVTPKRQAQPAAPRPAGNVISDAQRKRIYALAYKAAEAVGLKRDMAEGTVRDVVERHGYGSSTEIERGDYDSVCSEIETLLRGMGEPKPAADGVF